MINLPTKFEVSISVQYDDEKGYKMCKMGWFGVVRGHPRSLKIKIAPYDRAHTISSYWLYMLTMSLSCIVSEL